MWQVLGIYGVTSWMIYQVVLALYEGIGLPDWVPGTALVLLLIGLPIVLATAFVQEGTPGLQRSERGGDRRAAIEGLETSTDALRAQHRDEPGDPASRDPDRSRDGGAGPDTKAPSGAGLFTWGRAITGGVLAFAALGLAASGFMGMRALGIGPAATLVSSGVLEEREPILLAELESASGDSVLAAAVTEALRVDLESSSTVQLVSAARVREGLRRMRRDPASALTPDVAMELAVREGIRALVVGEVTAAGNQYVLTARVVDPEGQALAAVRETATPDEVIEAADRLSAGIRERLGESFKSIRATEPLEQVTTASLDALRRYSQGIRAFDVDPDAERAVVLLREALEYDSAFAMAWRKLGVAYQYIDGDSMRWALEQAFEHRDRLTDRERYLTEGTYYDAVESDTSRAMLAYETLLDLYPDEPAGLNNYARLLTMLDDHERATELYIRQVEVDGSSATSHRNLIQALARLGRYDEAVDRARVYAEQFPEHPQGPQFTGLLEAARSNYDAAIRHLERAAQIEEGTGAYALESIAMLRGRHERALRLVRERMADAPPEAREEFVTINEVLPLAWHRLDPGAALERLERTLTEERLRAMPPEDRPWFDLGMIRVLAGDIAGAERALERWREDSPEDFDPPEGRSEELMLEIRAARGEPEDAIRSNRSDAADGCLYCWVSLGRIYEAAGRPDSAIVAYESYLDPPLSHLWRVNSDRWMLPFVLQRLGALHEEEGNAEAAIRHYARFAELWADADPELQPRVEAARRALARLTGEGGP